MTLAEKHVGERISTFVFANNNFSQLLYFQTLNSTCKFHSLFRIIRYRSFCRVDLIYTDLNKKFLDINSRYFILKHLVWNIGLLWKFIKKVEMWRLRNVMKNWDGRNKNFTACRTRLHNFYCIKIHSELFYPFLPVYRMVRILFLSGFLGSWLAEVRMKKRFRPRAFQEKRI